MVIAEKQKAAELMDLCQEVIEFKNDQMKRYLEVLSFVKENEDNFPSLTEQQEQVEQLKAILTDSWPKPNMRTYIKLMNELTGALTEVKEKLRAEIREEYEKTFEQLEQSCKEQVVSTDILPKKDTIIKLRTQSENILVLQNNKNTDAFFAEISAKIMAEVAKRKPYPPADSQKPDEVREHETIVTNKVLTTRTITPLQTEEEVDKYLAGLTRQIMATINKGEAVMIVK